MTEEKNFGYLGVSFQQKLIKIIIEDKRYATTIIEVIDPHYFEGASFRFIIQNIKELYEKYNEVPSYDSISYKIKQEDHGDTSSKMHMDTLQGIKEFELCDINYVKDTAMNFCKQQVLKRELKVVQKIIDEGDFDSYRTIEKIIQDALRVGANTNDVRDVFENIREVIRKDARAPIPTGIDGIDDALKGGLGIGEFGMVLAPTGIGKSEPISEPLLTPTGWIKMGEVKVGDKVIGKDGKEQYVLGVYPQGIRPIYKIIFTDQTSVKCDEEHLWSVNTLNMRTAKTRVNGKGVYKPNYGYNIFKTSDMMKDIKKRGRYNYRLPVVEPVEFERKDILIDSYLLGLLLGDGCLPEKGNVSISTKDDELFDNINHLTMHSSFTEYTRQDIKTIKVIRFKMIISRLLSTYGLLGKKSNNKFIPNDYLYNSIDVRISLLQGLMDTDGYISKKGCVQFTTVSEELSKNIRELVLSLGGSARITTKTPAYNYKGEKKVGQLSYNVTISFANNIVPFRLLRKVTSYYKRVKYKEQKFIKSIEYSHNEEAVCIKVSNQDELYVTSDYVLTHNTTILTKFANSAYNCGFKVLQIIFEDNVNSVLRKHYTIWTGLSPDNLPTDTENVVEMLQEIEAGSKGVLKICKLPSDSVTTSELKGLLRKLAIEGFTPDLVIIDYVDCITPERATYGEEWKGEGAIMRHLEAMTNEFHIAIWAATQGNRESITTEVVTSNLMGGSIKKAQIAHVVLSVGKTLEQKENQLATISLLKSRIGKDGLVWQNCHFDNEYLTINTNLVETLLGHERSQEEKNKERAIEVWKAKRLADLQMLSEQLSAPNLQPSPVIKPNTSFDKPMEKLVIPTTITGAKELSKQEKIASNAHKREEKEKIRAQQKELKKEKVLEESLIST